MSYRAHMRKMRRIKHHRRTWTVLSIGLGGVRLTKVHTRTGLTTYTNALRNAGYLVFTWGPR